MSAECPLCGKSSHVVQHPGDRHIKASVGCHNCEFYVYAHTIDEALIKWNKPRLIATDSNEAAVRAFHVAFNHPHPTAYDTSPTTALRELRVRLIAEELIELAEAMGVDIYMNAGPHAKMIRNTVLDVTCVVNEPIDFVETADALGDLQYVVIGTNVALAIPGDKVFAEIHRSNISKLGADGKPLYREDGKILKGPNYKPPDIKGVLGL